MSVDQRPEIENLLLEERVFPPDPAFTAQANAQESLYAEAARDPEAFWARIARETVTWNEPCDWLPWASVAVHVTVVEPRGNIEPEAREHTGVTGPSTRSKAEAE